MGQLPPPYKVEQTVKKQVTIAAGATTTTSLTIPNHINAALKGYGYTYYASGTYQLTADQIQFPSRSDQEGSASIPRIFEQSIVIKPGAAVSLTITNGSASDHTYDIVFYFYLSQMFPNDAAYQSTGGELIITTGSGAGGGTSVAVYDSTFTTAAGVTAKGLAVEPQAPAALRDGSATTTADTAIALSTTVALKKGVLVQAASTNSTVMYVGNATSQSIELFPGDSEFIEIDDLVKVYIKRVASGANVKANYHGC